MKQQESEPRQRPSSRARVRNAIQQRSEGAVARAASPRRVACSGIQKKKCKPAAAFRAGYHTCNGDTLPPRRKRSEHMSRHHTTIMRSPPPLPPVTIRSNVAPSTLERAVAAARQREKCSPNSARGRTRQTWRCETHIMAAAAARNERAAYVVAGNVVMFRREIVDRECSSARTASRRPPPVKPHGLTGSRSRGRSPEREY